MTGDADTFPKLLIRNAQIRGSKPAAREKDFGIWQSWSWAQALEQVREIALGLSAMGVSRGDKLVIVGDNRPQLYWSICAAQAIGAVPVLTKLASNVLSKNESTLPMGGVKNATPWPACSGRPCAEAADTTASIAATAAIAIGLRMISSR